MQDEIKDQLGNEETQAGILLNLGRASQAEEIYRYPAVNGIYLSIAKVVHCLSSMIICATSVTQPLTSAQMQRCCYTSCPDAIVTLNPTCLHLLKARFIAAVLAVIRCCCFEAQQTVVASVAYMQAVDT